MVQFSLKYSSVVDGEFHVRPLNFMLTFQVNCPGCFFHALPVFEELKDRFDRDLSFSLLSTAFEDFALNTRENTEALVLHGAVVGETQRALAQTGQVQYALPRDVPVLFDQVEALESYLNDDMLEGHCAQLQPNFSDLTAEQQAQVRDYVRGRLLAHYSQVGYTFFANAMRGTPTFVLFSGEMQILATWFGHRPLAECAPLIQAAIDARRD